MTRNRTFRVETGVPVPAADRRHSKYPFDSLSVGQSFFIPDEFGISHNAVRQAVKEANIRYVNERQFVSRRVNRHDQRVGTRVWRVELEYKRGRGIRYKGVLSGEDGRHCGPAPSESQVRESDVGPEVRAELSSPDDSSSVERGDQ